MIVCFYPLSLPALTQSRTPSPKTRSGIPTGFTACFTEPSQNSFSENLLLNQLCSIVPQQRGGQEKPVTVLHLWVKISYHTHLAKATGSKRDVMCNRNTSQQNCGPEQECQAEEGIS